MRRLADVRPLYTLPWMPGPEDTTLRAGPEVEEEDTDTAPPLALMEPAVTVMPPDCSTRPPAATDRAPDVLTPYAETRPLPTTWKNKLVPSESLSVSTLADVCPAATRPTTVFTVLGVATLSRGAVPVLEAIDTAPDSTDTPPAMREAACMFTPPVTVTPPAVTDSEPLPTVAWPLELTLNSKLVPCIAVNALAVTPDASLPKMVLPVYPPVDDW